MTHLLLTSDLNFLALSIEKTIIFAIWYSTMFWLPVRFLAAVIDRRRAVAFLNEAIPDVGYRIGMDVEPPM